MSHTCPDVFYMSTEVFFNQTDLLNYMNGLVVGDANADQPVLSAAVAVQAYAPQMNIYSNILVLTDGRASDATSEDLHYPPRNNETYLIAQTLQWRNRITFLLTQTSDAPIDISGDGFDVYRRVSRAVQGDLLMLDKKELNSTLYNIVSYFSNVQVLNASYGMTSNFTFDLHPYYHDYKSCTILVSVESGQRLPNVTFPGAYVSDLSPTFNNSQFIMFAVRGKDVSSLEIIPYSGPYNVLISTQGDNDLVWITFVDDPSIDGGYSFAFSEKQMAASGAETYYGSIGLDFYTAPINWENGTISRTFYGIGRCLSNCDFCWTFENVDACKPGPFNIITTVTESSSCSMQPCYIYVIITVPGFCFIRDSDSDGKNENHIF